MLVFLLALSAGGVSAPAQEAAPTAAAPFRVADGLFDSSRPDDLGLQPAPGARTVTIFRSGDTGPRYHNGVVLLPFQGRLYAQWQCSAQDEDSPDTHVVYSVSDDGEHWSAPRALVPGGTGSAWHSSGGWWTDGKTLTAFVNVWPGALGRGGRAECLSSGDGVTWSGPRPVLDKDGAPMNGIIEQDPHVLPDGRLLTAFHLQPGLIATPCFTEDPTGVAGWTSGLLPHLPHSGPQSRELEPSWFARRDGSIVMVFRDQASTHLLLAAESADRGATWTTAVLTNMPDSRSKQSAGNLPDGTAFIVNVPASNRSRLPLTVTLSRDGRVFHRSFTLRTGGTDLPTLRYPGKFKRPGFHYPKSIVWNGRLWVGYATNKEDVEVTSVPVAELER